MHREAIIYIEREQAPAAAGAIFLQVTRPGGSVPFCRRRFETAPRETGAHCVSPLPHTPTPGILPAGEKKKGDFLKSGEKGERKIDQTIIGIDHGYYAMKTRHCVFPTGITAYDHEPYTRQDVLEYEGRWYVCGTGRQPLQRDKTASENYYLLTLAAIAKELRQRRMEGQCSVTLAAGLPLTGFGREKGAFEKYDTPVARHVRPGGRPRVVISKTPGEPVSGCKRSARLPCSHVCGGASCKYGTEN